MKIILLNPYINAQHGISAHLRGLGMTLIFPTSAEEAWKMIQVHGSSLDLAIIHREPAGMTDKAGDGNFSLFAQVKGDPAYSDLPLIGTSSVWTDADFVAHQSGSAAANAYLRWPFLESDLVKTIEAMFGTTLGSGSTAAPVAAASSDAPAAYELPVLEDAIKLEETTSFEKPQSPETPAIVFELETPPAPPVLAAAVEPASTPASISGGIELSFAPPPIPSEPQLQAPPPGEINLSLEEAPVESAAESAPEQEPVAVPPPGEDGLEPHERLMLAGQAGDTQHTGPSLIVDEPTKPIETLSPAEPQEESHTLAPAPEESIDDELAADLPYLFHPKKGEKRKAAPSILLFAEPVGNAVIPGGAAQSPDVETLKKYLLLREQDVAVLSNQLRAAREQIESLASAVKDAEARNNELSHTVDEQKRRIDEFEREKVVAVESLEKENDELRFQHKAKADKARILEMQVREATDEIERLKERVRTDIRKIRVRERELENRLEIMKKDSEALIAARENKIIELKRKIDLLEFNMDLLQDQYSREKENSAQLRERLGKAAQVVRVAGGLLDSDPDPGSREAS